MPQSPSKPYPRPLAMNLVNMQQEQMFYLGEHRDLHQTEAEIITHHRALLIQHDYYSPYRDVLSCLGQGRR